MLNTVSPCQTCLSMCFTSEITRNQAHSKAVIYRNVDASVQLEDKLVIDSDEEGGIPLEFLQELTGKSEEEPVLKEAFQKAIETLSRKLSTMEMCDIYKPYLDVSILTLDNLWNYCLTDMDRP